MPILNYRKAPVVLVLAGHDPSGGAGLSADIEAIRAQQVWAVTVATALTVQDTRKVYQVQAVDAQLIEAQVQKLSEDFNIAAIKIGLVPNLAVLEVIVRILDAHPKVPVVLDPVLRSGAGPAMNDAHPLPALAHHRLAYAHIATPNTLELAALAQAKTPNLVAEAGTPLASQTTASGLQYPDEHQAQQAYALLQRGCHAVLVTGTHADSPAVKNTLYQSDVPPITHRWSRLDNEYHGSGCTLASALAARLALGEPLEVACLSAQDYTWRSLHAAYQIGQGQLLPQRLFNHL